MKKNVFFKAGILLLSLLLLPGLTGCGAISSMVATPTPQNISADEIPVDTFAKQVSHAEAWNSIFFPWPVQDFVFTEGPFKDYRIETDEKGRLTGYRIYVHSNRGSFRPQDIKAFYERKLVQEWWPKEENWQRVDLNETRNLWAWKRGGQVFIVACGDAEYVNGFHTYLISK